METISEAFCRDILPDVSRSFALIIPQCPPPIDRALGIAYLLCRIADTVEDEPALSDGERSALYDAFVAAVDAPADDSLATKFVRLWPEIPEGSYGRLIAECRHVLAEYRLLPAVLIPPIQTCVHDMVAGMREMQPVEVQHGIQFICRDLDELDTYCHIVAGTVGIMSTVLFEWRFGPRFRADDAWHEAGRRFGLGLQMTNIIKDCCVDAERGTSFIPASCVDFSGGSYELHDAGRRLLIAHAVEHLNAGMEYILASPVEETGVRTFLLGSLLPAIATLEVAARGTEYQPKIDRNTMGEIFQCIQTHGADNAALTAWYKARRQRATA